MPLDGKLYWIKQIPSEPWVLHVQTSFWVRGCWCAGTNWSENTWPHTEMFSILRPYPWRKTHCVPPGSVDLNIWNVFVFRICSAFLLACSLRKFAERRVPAQREADPLTLRPPDRAVAFCWNIGWEQRMSLQTQCISWTLITVLLVVAMVLF